jgi:hypothetical protein
MSKYFLPFSFVTFFLTEVAAFKCLHHTVLEDGVIKILLYILLSRIVKMTNKAHKQNKPLYVPAKANDDTVRTLKPLGMEQNCKEAQHYFLLITVHFSLQNRMILGNNECPHSIL